MAYGIRNGQKGVSNMEGGNHILTAEGAHVLHGLRVVLVLNDGGRLQVQDALHLLADPEADLVVAVVCVPHTEEVLVLPNAETDPHHIRLFEVLTNRCEHYVVPELAQNRRAEVFPFLDLEDPAATPGVGLYDIPV
jgi:hypothetical protein